MARILLITHPDLLPTKKTSRPFANKCEKDLVSALTRLQHKVTCLGLLSDIGILYDEIERERPDLVFNLVEEFGGEAFFDQNVVSLLEILRVPYTGCNPRGLILGRDKSLAKKILNHHALPTPRFFVLSQTTKKTEIRLNLQGMKFPLIVKCLIEESSTGLSQSSIVHNIEKLEERIAFMQSRYNVDLIIEEFIEGRELFVSLIGNERIKFLQPRELVFKNSAQPSKQFYSRRAKFDPDYQKRHGINTQPADLTGEQLARLSTLSKLAYRALYLTGYARLDYRMAADGQFYLIEANPNPDLSQDEEFALSAKQSGMSYSQMIESIIDGSLKRRALYPAVA